MRQYKYRKQFKKLYVNIAQYFRQSNARTHQENISHELLSMDNFATFHQIYSNICLKSSRYLSHYHKTWSGEFRNKGTAKFAKNRRFRNRVYSLLPSCSTILDFSCWTHFRYVCVSNLCLIYLWSLDTLYMRKVPVFAPGKYAWCDRVPSIVFTPSYRSSSFRSFVCAMIWSRVTNKNVPF